MITSVGTLVISKLCIRWLVEHGIRIRRLRWVILASIAIKPRESVVSLCVIRMSVPCNGLNVKTANMLPLWDNSRDRLEKPLLPLLDCRDTVSPLPHILSPQPWTLDSLAVIIRGSLWLQSLWEILLPVPHSGTSKNIYLGSCISSGHSSVP